MAVLLSGEAVIRLPAVALVLPLLSRQDAARLLHRVVVGLLDLGLHDVEVLCVELSGQTVRTLTFDGKFLFSFMGEKTSPVAGQWSWSYQPKPPPLCCSHPPWKPGRLTSLDAKIQPLSKTPIGGDDYSLI